jgi:hypothetical protein
MRFAAIADVHGNYLALEAVIADIRALDILEFADGAWRATFRHVPYDRDAMAALACQNRQPELASALAKGWIR